MAKHKSFAQYELDPHLLSQLPKLGFKRPTQVQEKVIPLFLQKRNVIVEAPTGTGKTAAYGLPLIHRLNLLKRSTQALVLVPSRELALQVSQALQSYYDGKQLKVKAVYGGVTMEESFRALKSSPHILVAIPGRLRDVMAQYQYDFLWRDIRFLIIDEGDKLMESEFQVELDAIRKNVRSRAQVGFFSATISPDSEAMMRERYPHIQTVRIHPKQVLRNISFRWIKSKKGQRDRYLATLLQTEQLTQALIFVGRRDTLYAVSNFLRNAGYRAEAYYGNQEQHERANILKRFKEGHIQYLVATDLASRGLDIPDLPAVVNLSIPKTFDYYLHRVGRTGRAGRKGKVYNLISSEGDLRRQSLHHRHIGLPVEALRLELSRPQVSAESKWIKCHFSRGKRDKIRKTDLVGFLTQAAGLDASQIGTITVYDSYSLVDLQQQSFTRLTQLPGPLKLKGKSLKVRKYQLAEEQRKAQAIRRLKQDRR